MKGTDWVKKLQKKYGSAVTYLDDPDLMERRNTFIPTGVFSVDYIIGRPGLPLGRIIEIAGWPSSGKSALCMRMMSSFQKLGGEVVLWDTEQSYTKEFAAVFELKPIVIVQPDHLQQMVREQIPFTIKHIRESNFDKPVILCIDSLSIATEEEVEEDMSDKALGQHARILSKSFRAIGKQLYDSKISLVVVSQLKSKPMAWGRAVGKLGGYAVDYHAAIQLEMNRQHAEPDGILVKLKCVKNKVSFPFKETTVDLNWETGFDDTKCIMQLAVDAKLLTKRSGFYYGPDGEPLPGKNKGVRQEEAVNTVVEQVVKSVFPEVDYAGYRQFFRTCEGVPAEEVSEDVETVAPKADTGGSTTKQSQFKSAGTVRNDTKGT